jgi:hypothetical protein
MRIKRFLLGLGTAGLLAATSAGSSGCYVGHHGYVHADPLDMCLMGACIGAHVAESTRPVYVSAPPPQAPEYSIVYLRNHDGHFHGDGCGCASRWMNGRHVFWYGGHWEFYDGRCWCMIEGGGGPSW